VPADASEAGGGGGYRGRACLIAEAIVNAELVMAQ
jgi:hypothetical protein